MNFLHQIFDQYLPIVVGLVGGALAHFGRLLSENNPPNFVQALGYLLQLGFIGLLASVVTRMMNMTDSDTRALATAILAVAAQELVQWAKKSGWRPFANNLIPGSADKDKDDGSN